MSDRLMIRMTAPLLVTSLLLLAVAVGAAWQVQELHQQTTEILFINVASMRAAEELEISLREVRTCLDRFRLDGEMEHLEAIPALKKETERWLAEAERVATTDREQQLMSRIRQGHARFFAELDHAGNDGLVRQELSRLTDRLLSEEILQPTHEYLDWNEEQVARGAVEHRRKVHRAVICLLLLGSCGPGAGLLAGLGMARRVNRSLLRLTLPIRDAAGKLEEVIGPVTLKPGWGLDDLEKVVVRMATQIGDVLARLQQSQREALRAEQLAAVGQMAAGVAHELRNPLMSMKILVQSARFRHGRFVDTGLAEGVGSGHPRAVATGGTLGGRDLLVLEEEIIRLERLTSTLLDFARPPQPEKRTFDIRLLLEDTINLVAGRASRRRVRIDGPSCDRPVWLEADNGQLRQVVLNLLLNALEAVAEGGTITVEVQTDDQGVEIVVLDDGPGLPAHLGEDIFAPFVSTRPTGLGLGLSICRRIAQVHGGDITAADRPEGGAVFRVRFPGSSAVPGGSFEEESHANPAGHR